ncbi:MAG: outer membrane beta-barrel protein, partial [Salibacteraceae bacterium]
MALGVNITDDSRTEFGSRQVGTRMGLNFGPGVTGRLSKNLDLSVEMLYSQNGSYTPLDEISSTAVDKIALHYLELPITLAYGLDIRNDSEAELSKLSLGGG